MFQRNLSKNKGAIQATRKKSGSPRQISVKIKTQLKLTIHQTLKESNSEKSFDRHTGQKHYIPTTRCVGYKYFF